MKMITETITFLLVVIHVNVYVLGAENYIVPVNLTFISDNSIETCAVFKADARSEKPQLTTFRVPVYDKTVDYLNVTLTGQNLSCGYNLYVIPLTAPQAKGRTGIWIVCPLLTTSVREQLETCSFNCHCLGGCDEIQVSKRPRKAGESDWSLCHLAILPISAGFDITKDTGPALVDSLAINTDNSVTRRGSRNNQDLNLRL